MIAARRPPRSLAGPIGVSVLLHAAVILPLLILSTRSGPPLPPMYKVQLIAAPAGERAAGVVTTAPAPVVPTKAPAKAAIQERVTVKVPAKSKKAPQKQIVQATPKLADKQVAPTKDPPKAGGGPEGGKGADVQSIKTDGIDFPFPGYLTNIVRQIALNFSPKGNVGALRAEVWFMIHRDGTVTGFRFLTRSSNMMFDIEAQGAVEAASHSFGPLPSGYGDDVLPIVFSFDPSKLR
jgi:periplasmic protein TonB